MTETLSTLEFVKRMKDKVENHNYEPDLAMYPMLDLPEVKADKDLWNYAWDLAHPSYWTPKRDALNFMDLLIERLEANK